MIVDCHNHVLSAGPDGGYADFIHDLKRADLQVAGALPADREPTEDEWAQFDFLTKGIAAVDLIEQRRTIGVDRSVVLATSPSEYTAYGRRGTVDLSGETSVSGEPDIDKANDYIAGLVEAHPDDLIGMAAVNPRHRAVDAAVTELGRAIESLGLTGLKLYPSYDHWSPDDEELAVPVFAAANDLGIGVMVHMGRTPVRGAVLEFGHPARLDEVARRFPDLRLLICHAGFPWVDEALVVAARHTNVYLDVSDMLSTLTGDEVVAFLKRAAQLSCPSTRICFGTDNPPPDELGATIARFALAALETGPVDHTAGMMGGNFARFAGLDWDLEATLASFDEWEPRWRGFLTS